MKVVTASQLSYDLGEPGLGSVVIMALANGTLMAYRHGTSDGGAMNREYRWWMSDKPANYHATSWVEVKRSGAILAVFYP